MTNNAYKPIKLSSKIRKNLKENDGLTWRFEDNTLYLDGKNKKVKIKSDVNGLSIDYNIENYKKKDKLVYEQLKIAGEFSFDRVIDIISGKTELPILQQKPSKEKVFSHPINFFEYTIRDQKLTIATALRKYGVWKNRGYSTINKSAPKEYWNKLTDDIIKKYNTYQEPSETWKAIILKDTKSTWEDCYEFGISDRYKKNIQSEKKILRDAGYRKTIELKIIPEVPWGIRKWTNFSYDSLAIYTTSGLIRSKNWANYASTCFMFDKTMQSHDVFSKNFRKDSPLYQQRDKFLEFLYTWPKTKAGISSLEEAFNQGMNVKNILDIQPKNPKELLDCLQIWRQYSQENRLKMTSEYIPPNLLLNEGYKYVDHTDCLQMSNWYSCCFSNASNYINNICKGCAFAIYRPKFSGNDKGSLCFFKLDIDKKTQKPYWRVYEHRGFGNSIPNEKYSKDMQLIARTLTITHPYEFPKVTQDNEKNVENLGKINPKFLKTYHAVKNNNHQIFEQISDLCIETTLQDVLKAEGCDFDIETYVWKETSPENMQEYQNKNKRAENLLAGLPEFAIENNNVTQLEQNQQRALARV